MQNALSKLIFPSFDEESNFRRANQRMNAMANARAIKNSATLLADVEALAKDIRAGWLESTETVKKAGEPKKRLPATAKYGPSTGPNGNLTGREFPANMWALTFDDGPAQQTASILDALKNVASKRRSFGYQKMLRPSLAAVFRERSKKGMSSAIILQLTHSSQRFHPVSSTKRSLDRPIRWKRSTGRKSAFSVCLMGRASKCRRFGRVLNRRVLFTCTGMSILSIGRIGILTRSMPGR